MSYFLTQETGSETRREALDKIGKLPVSTPNSEQDTKEQIALGEKIFRDNKLSKNQVQSCLTCHPIDGNRAGMDRQSTSLGTFGQTGKRNTPSILNVGYLPTLFWDGRRTKLEDQAIDPFLDPLEMTLDSETELLNKLQSDQSYSVVFANAYPESPGISIQSLKNALAAFERSLVSRSRFDDFIDGNLSALSGDEKVGLQLFMDVGCTNCHNGNLLGGRNFGKVDNIYSYNPNDMGRFEFTGNESDKYFFKIPPLRNVILTQPYFHDGSVQSIQEAVNRMNAYNLNRQMNRTEINSIISFLHSLSDKAKVAR